MNRRIAIRSTIAAMTILGGGLAVAMPAFAGGTGNVTNNCWGIYYNTDWDQTCGPTYGANKTGNYHSDADCNDQPDKTKVFYRLRGDKQTFDGPDCSWRVSGVFTTFFN